MEFKTRTRSRGLYTRPAWPQLEGALTRAGCVEQRAAVFHFVVCYSEEGASSERMHVRVPRVPCSGMHK